MSPLTGWLRVIAVTAVVGMAVQPPSQHHDQKLLDYEEGLKLGGKEPSLAGWRSVEKEITL